MALSFRAGASWRETFRVYRNPRVLAMLFLGFSAGLPFLLVFSTLSAWLTDFGISRSTIGFFSWAGITYSIKLTRLERLILERVAGDFFALGLDP